MVTGVEDSMRHFKMEARLTKVLSLNTRKKWLYTRSHMRTFFTRLPRLDAWQRLGTVSVCHTLRSAVNEGHDFGTAAKLVRCHSPVPYLTEQGSPDGQSHSNLIADSADIAFDLSPIVLIQSPEGPCRLVLRCISTLSTCMLPLIR